MLEEMGTNTARIIYVELLDEGTSVRRPTEGVALGSDIYRILPTPNYDTADEHWEFLPGSVVRCIKVKTQDGEEILVASELVR